MGSQSLSLPSLPLSLRNQMTMTFSQLCERWNQVISRGKSDDLSLNIRNQCRCIVGEAWGFSNRYFYEENVRIVLTFVMIFQNI
jgi:hypothetical protein